MTTAWTIHTNANLFFEKRKIENWPLYCQAYISAEEWHGCHSKNVIHKLLMILS